MNTPTFSVFDGNTFVISNGRGDLDPGPNRLHGYFCDDTRFLRRWALTVDGRPLDSLSVANIEYFAAQFFLVPAAKSIYENPYLSVIRRRLVRGNWIEDLRLLNHHDDSVDVELCLDADTDFADLFEVKDEDVREREIGREVRGHTLVMSYKPSDTFLRETHITASADFEVAEDGFRAKLSLDPREERWMSFEVRAHAEQEPARLPVRAHATSFEEARTEMDEDLREWLTGAPELETEWDELRHVYRQSLVDLAALRFYPPLVPGASMPAAGLPWFMTVFGRDSLIASYQALPMQSELARTTLVSLAARQAEFDDAFRDQEPGKILHEVRYGELTVSGERPFSPYFGSADATELFLVLLDEYERWTGDGELVRQLEPHARSALRWIDRHGDLDGDGYVEYQRRNQETGLENQCWKDSHNAILFADGTKAEGPIATCEIQGYVYDAKRRCARLAAEFWDDAQLAARLDREAAELKRRFHEDFWIEELGHYALALDGEKRKVDSLASNVGHLLWSGIVDAEPAAQIARHLMSDRMFSGWGVRTMAEGLAGYNPIEYHNGTVWPHDNSLIAEGLRRYGFRAEAARIAVALVEAAGYFSGRLPEVFAGYPRSLTRFPVEYPTASSPQAWASGAPLLFLRSLLGLDPVGEGLEVDAALPEHLTSLGLRGIPGRWGRADAGASAEARL